MSWIKMVRADAGGQEMKWKDMTGPERYRVVEMARKGERPLVEICRSFDVSRQVLNKAMEKASQAAIAALQPKSPGRKGPSEEELRIGELVKETTGLQKKVDHWKTRYEVAQAFIDLTREAEQKQQRGRKKKKKRRRPSDGVPKSGPQNVVASLDDGQNAGDSHSESGAVDEST